MPKEQKGENLAIIYSVRHRNVNDIIPFEIVNGKMIFEEHKSKKQGIFSGFSRKQAPIRQTPIQPVPFSDSIAVYNQQRGAWLTIISLETHTQLPIVSGSQDTLIKILQMERNVEGRVSRLKSSSTAIKSYIETSTPREQLGNVQVVGLILLFVGIIAIAYGLNSVAGALGGIDKTLTALKGLKIIGAGGISILLQPRLRQRKIKS